MRGRRGRATDDAIIVARRATKPRAAAWRRAASMASCGTGHRAGGQDMATAYGEPVARTAGDRFHFRYAIAFMAIAFLGFTPTYWLRIATGTFHAAPIYHVHGLLFFTWTLFYLAQTWLVAAGRTPDHRSWGLAGIALFAVMVCSVVAANIASMQGAERHGFGEAARRFSGVSLLGLIDIVVLFGCAIAFVRRRDLHRRFMLLMMAQLMIPAIARVFVTLLAPGGGGAGPPPPPLVTLPPHLVGALLVIPAMIRDRRTIGRVHPIYRYGLAVIVPLQVAELAFAGTGTWAAIAGGIEHLLG